MPTQFNIIFFGNWWDERWLRQQQLAYRLAQHPEVAKLIYIEYPITLTGLLKSIVGRSDTEATPRWRRALKHGLVRNMGKVRVITPVSPIGIFRNTRCSGLNERLTRWATRQRVLRGLGGIHKDHQTLLFLGEPIFYRHIGGFDEKLLCYDCTEQFAHYFTWDKPFHRLMVEADSFVSHKADVILVQTGAHLEERRQVNGNTYLVPNGVDVDVFLNNSSGAFPTDIQSIHGPILGFVGSIGYRIDGQLLLSLAQAHPEWSFVFIGSIKDDTLAPLGSLSNVHFLGMKPYSSLPSYISCFDVCLVPYRLLPELGSPIKLFDYMAGGKPIVTTHIEGVKGFEDVVYVATDAKDWEQKIKLALQQDIPEMAKARKERALANSWDARANQVWAIVRGKLEANCQPDCGVR